MSQNYKETLQLPKTDFPMKADLVKREPERLRNGRSKGSTRRSRLRGKTPSFSSCTTARPLPMATCTWAPR
jgi:isoleucyl-tRNA synthetase